MKYFVTLTILCLFTTCRKKSDIEITAYNYALGEPIANAEVIIVENTLRGGLFNASSDCKEIASATTDDEGRCAFDNLKLKTKKGVQYAAKIKHSYGKDDFYNCSVTQNSEVKLGNTRLILNSSDYEAYIKVQFNNILNPSIPGDSIWFSIKTREYHLPGSPYSQGGGGLLYTVYKYNGNTYPPVFSSNLEKTYAGRLPFIIYKRKLGVMTQIVDTIKIYPYETKLIEINW